jgi:uncharacterized protein
MVQSIFINLPIKSLKESVKFFSALGFKFNPQFTSEDTTCMIIGENMFAMLLEKDVFEGFMDKKVPDSKKYSEVLVALMLDSKEEVNSLMVKAFEAGARRYREPEDLGFMYSWGFEDPDGHIWELGWMDPAQLNQN